MSIAAFPVGAKAIASQAATSQKTQGGPRTSTARTTVAKPDIGSAPEPR